MRGNYIERVVDSGSWGVGNSWETVISPRRINPRLCTAVACVAIANIDQREVVLTRYPYDDNPARRGKREVLAGHIDLRNPADPESSRETSRQALCREALEEAGFVVARAVPFAHRRVINEQPSEYPPESYMQYYWATTTKPLVEPTDPNQPAERTFPIETVREFVEAGTMNSAELVIIEHGLAAALRDLRGIEL